MLGSELAEMAADIDAYNKENIIALGDVDDVRGWVGFLQYPRAKVYKDYPVITCIKWCWC